MLGRRSFDEPPLRGGSTQLSCTMSAAVTPSESDLCKFEQNSPNPHRNDSKVPTRHFRAGGKRSNNITQQSSMGPTEQIYITATQGVKNTNIIYKDPNHLENDRASSYGQDANGAKSPEE